MKRTVILMFVLLLIGVVYNNAYAQAYKTINIESEDNYRARKSFQNEREPDNAPKSYISADFKTNKNVLAYRFTSDGIVIDNINNVRGVYYVGGQAGYKISKVYIRWSHGGTQKGTLNYGERTDGRPVLRIYKSTGTQIYDPLF